MIAILWIAFTASWIIAAFWQAQSEKRAALKEEAAYQIVLLIGTVMLLIPAHGYRGWMRIWFPSLTLVWICIGLMVVGFAFCWWARIYLGPLWSSQVTKKPDHHVVDTGPYGLVRHPIYTGILLAVLATAVVKGTVLGIAGTALVTLAFWMKARLEERFLRAELGAGAYDDYSRRVPMLIPFL